MKRVTLFLFRQLSSTVPCGPTLALGVHDNKFFLWWPREAKEVILSSGHMLSSAAAPGLIRFLADLERDSTCQLTPFHWGSLEASPFLPRIQRGRIVLRPAQWHLNSVAFQKSLPLQHHAEFLEKFRIWREEWDVPRYVYLSDADHRLLLDLDYAAHIDEIRRELIRSANTQKVLIEEGIPGPNDAWLHSQNGSYLSEIVVSLALQPSPSQISHPVNEMSIQQSRGSITHTDRVKPMSSDWLYVKIYCSSTMQDGLLIEHIKPFIDEIRESHLASRWFFMRYTDPEPHIRLRFQGQPHILLHELLPKLSALLAALLEIGACQKFAYDVYEREIERYGGLLGMTDAEQFFYEDSISSLAVLSLMYHHSIDLDAITINVMLMDQILQVSGMDRNARSQWVKSIIQQKPEEGAIYRKKGPPLRKLLGSPEKLQAIANGAYLRAIMTQRDEAMLPIIQSLLQCHLDKPLTEILKSLTHMQSNRLLGIDPLAERETLILLQTVNQSLFLSSL